MKLRTILAASGLAALIPLASAAYAADDVLIVFDASGSMWGQIEGTNKIVTARTVMQELVANWPEDTNLGLIAYGHRQAGDCSDIETLIEPQPIDKQQFIKTVKAINPKGKTPIAASLEQAAEVLKYRDNNATVVLISDGLESCHGDPCAVAAKLNETGVNFTAHVVGFDLDDAGNDALSCIATNTGGTFVPAANAQELQAALQEVQTQVTQSANASAQIKPASITTKPAAEPELPAVTTAQAQLRATDMEGGPTITSGLRWVIRHGATGDIIFEENNAGEISVDLPAGVHDVEVLRIDDEAFAEAELQLPASGARLTIPLIVTHAASLKAPESAPAGETVRVIWTGPNENSDYIGVFALDTDNSNEIHYFYTQNGNPFNLKIPEVPGTYEIRYILNKSRQTLASTLIEATPIEATIVAPDSAQAGKNVRVSWTGPDYSSDYIAVFAPDGNNNQEIHYFYTYNGNPYNLKMPDKPGTYEIRYILNSSRQDLARHTITVTE